MNNSNLVEAFGTMSGAIAAKYTAKVQMSTIEKGVKPTFDELMLELQELQKELTQEGVKFIEKCNVKDAAQKEDLSNQVKDLIMSTIQSFVKTL